MLPLTHLILSSIIAIVLYPIFGWYVLIFVLAGVLFDIDHVLMYFIDHKKIDLKKAYQTFHKKKGQSNIDQYKGRIFLFHTIEALAIFFVLGIFYKTFLMIFLGLFFHMILDWISEIYVLGEKIKANSIIICLLSRR